MNYQRHIFWLHFKGMKVGKLQITIFDYLDNIRSSRSLCYSRNYILIRANAVRSYFAIWYLQYNFIKSCQIVVSLLKVCR